MFLCKAPDNLWTIWSLVACELEMWGLYVGALQDRIVLTRVLLDFAKFKEVSMAFL